jgi:hypothetical protein
MRSILERDTISNNALAEFASAVARRLVSRVDSSSAIFCTNRGVNHTAALTSPRTSTTAFIPRINRIIHIALDEAVHEHQLRVVCNSNQIEVNWCHLDTHAGHKIILIWK